MFKLVRCVAALSLAVSSAAMFAHAQTARYPIRTIEITVSYGAGGSTDLVARAIAQKFQERLGQPAVVRNLPGASGDRFSLLPAENATGNYVKVVQRLPVRIEFDPGQDPEHRLHPGMSVEPKVWLR